MAKDLYQLSVRDAGMENLLDSLRERNARRTSLTPGGVPQREWRDVVKDRGKIQSLFISPNDSRWRDVLARVAHDVYHLPEYVAAMGKQGGMQALAFYAEDEEAACLIPLLRRQLPDQLEAPADWCDLLSPYGYASPLYTHPEDSTRSEDFLDAFVTAADELGACSVFLRLHPLLSDAVRVRAAPCCCKTQGQTVSIDLTCSEEEMWQQTRAGHRQSIRRLEKSKFMSVVDDWCFLPEFIRMYQQTMQRVGAAAYYRFSIEYFTELRAALGDHLHLCCILSPEGRPAAAGLFTGVGGVMQYHLSGTDAEFQRLAPTKLMLHLMRLWGKQHGNSTLHLGGGLGADRDGLFQFKAGFSHDLHDFQTCRIIANEDRYRMLVLRAGLPLNPNKDMEAGHFPPYP